MAVTYSNKKLIWLGIPRTGTTSINKVLNSNFGNAVGHKHKPIKCFNTNYYYLTFVRNPYSRMLSLYGWMCNIKNNKIKFKDFLKMLKDADVSETDKTPMHWISQSNYIKNPNSFNFIGRYESYIDDIHSFLKDFNIDSNIKIPHLYKGKIGDEYMTSEFINIVNSKYEDDFIKFNYNKL